MKTRPFRRPRLDQILRILRYARPHRRCLWIAAFGALAAGAFELLQIVVFRGLVDSTIRGASWQQTTRSTGLLLGAILLAIAADAVHGYQMSLASQRVAVDLQNQVHTHLHKLHDDFFLQRPPGELAYRTFQDAAAAQGAIGILAGTLIRQPIALMVPIGYVLHMSPLLALLAALFAVLSVGVAHGSARSLRSFAARLAENRSAVVEDFLALLNARDVLRFYDPTGYRKQSTVRMNRNFNEIGQDYLRRRFTALAISHAFSAMLAILLVCAAAGAPWTRMAAGSMAALLAALLMLYRPLKSLAGIGANLQDALISAQRVFEILDQPEVWNGNSGGSGITAPIRTIELAGVQYEFPERNFVLPAITLTLHGGQMVALHGPSGCGKSTLRRLLTRAITPVRGRILWNGTPYEGIAQKSFAEQVACLPQNCPVAGGTIRTEIAAGSSDVSNYELERAAAKAGLLEWILSLPDRWNTVIGPGGLAVSGGERQRLGLARLFLRHRLFYVLDEATSQIDRETEDRVLGNLREHVRLNGGICLLICHRTANLRFADQAYRMDAAGIHHVTTNQTTAAHIHTTEEPIYGVSNGSLL